MIYLDNAATTKPDEECLAAAQRYLTEKFFNPSALYKDGFGVQQSLREAKSNILSLLGGVNYDLTFTSCGTEADNLAIFGAFKRGNAVTTSGEHSAVYSSFNELKQRGADVRFCELNPDGSANLQSLLGCIDDKTALVSVIHVSNETGAINDVARIAGEVKRINPKCIVHADGVQAFGKIPFKLTNNIDLYSVSAHKIGGLKGCGALVRKKNLVLKPLIFGGGQENGLRSGTENVFAVKNFQAAALKRYKNLAEYFAHAQSLNKLLWEKLDKNLFIKISPDENCSPYILTVAASGVRGETILHEADDRGLIIGTGSACASNSKRRYSRVILACGIKERVADGILRISFSPENTREEVLTAAEILNGVVANRKLMME